MKLTKTHKIIIGLAVGGGALWWWMNKKKGKKATEEGDAQVKKDATKSSPESGTAEPKTREEKENYVIENTKSSAKEDSTGFDGDRFSFDPEVGYEMPSGTIEETNADNEFSIDFGIDGSHIEFDPEIGYDVPVGTIDESDADEDYDLDLPSSVDFGFDGADDVGLDDLDDIDVFYDVEGVETPDPVAEAKAIVQEMSDDELDTAVKVTKVLKADATVPQEEAIKGVGKEGMMQKLMGMLNDLKALKKQPDWKIAFEKAKADRKAGRKSYLNVKRKLKRKLRKELRALRGGDRKALKKARRQRRRKLGRLKKGAKGIFWGMPRRKGKKLSRRWCKRKKFKPTGCTRYQGRQSNPRGGRMRAMPLTSGRTTKGGGNKWMKGRGKLRKKVMASQLANRITNRRPLRMFTAQHKNILRRRS